MFRHEVFKGTEYLGEVDSKRELQVDEGLAHYDGRVFRIVRADRIGPVADARVMLQVTQANDTVYSAIMLPPNS
jgi:hypothetical protein